MREVISSPKPRPQRSSHLHIRTKYGVVRPKEAPSSTFKPPSYSHQKNPPFQLSTSHYTHGRRSAAAK